MTRSPPPEIVAAGFDGTCDVSSDGWVKPSVFIQWKGTDVCMDFHCGCGAHCHYDGDFAYTVKCPRCFQAWEMPHVVYPRKVGAETSAYWRDNPKLMDCDDDDN